MSKNKISLVLTGMKNHETGKDDLFIVLKHNEGKKSLMNHFT